MSNQDLQNPLPAQICLKLVPVENLSPAPNVSLSSPSFNHMLSSNTTSKVKSVIGDGPYPVVFALCISAVHLPSPKPPSSQVIILSKGSSLVKGFHLVLQLAVVDGKDTEP